MYVWDYLICCVRREKGREGGREGEREEGSEYMYMKSYMYM